MNLYTEIIAKGLAIELEDAEKIQNFIETWFDDFRFNSATEKKIIRTAKVAQAMISDPRYAELLGA